MFIKIKYLDVEKDQDGMVVKHIFKVEDLYECTHYALFPTTPPSPEESDGNGLHSDEKKMNLYLEFNKSGPEGWDTTISFPCESDNQTVSIYVMNEHGKTIERYLY